MPFAEDFAPFLDTAEFATAAEWLSPVMGVKTAVKGIFDNGYGDAFDGLLGGQQPTFVCEAAIVAQAAQDDSLVIGADEYTVLNIEPDGLGLTTLRLRKI